jgi:D-sedoheptulose 7-phosphate isomerase
MDKQKFARNYFEKLAKLSAMIDTGEIEKVISMIEETYDKGNIIFIAGNGGSAATASHMVCDLSKTTGKNIKAISLSDNVPTMSAIGNDISFDQVFSIPLKILAKKGDMLLVITGSGNSKNIIEVIKTANDLGMKTAGFLGFDGGKCRGRLDASILIPSNEYGPVEDFHMILDHLMTEYFKKQGD